MARNVYLQHHTFVPRTLFTEIPAWIINPIDCWVVLWMERLASLQSIRYFCNKYISVFYLKNIVVWPMQFLFLMKIQSHTLFPTFIRYNIVSPVSRGNWQMIVWSMDTHHIRFVKDMRIVKLNKVIPMTHYGDVIMGAIASQITASRLFTQPFIQTQIKENIKAPRHWPLCGEFTGDRWIPRTNGQWRGKCFHLMTSSCKMNSYLTDVTAV